MDPNWLAQAAQESMQRRQLENQQAADYMARSGGMSDLQRKMGGAAPWYMQSTSPAWARINMNGQMAQAMDIDRTVPRFAGQFNTPLNPAQMQEYSAWASQNGRTGDLHDYDMQGWWRDNGQGETPQGGAHFPDTYKKPNHPTFSTESQYHGRDGAEGGTWEKDGKAWTFTPGRTNMQMHGERGLVDYFKRVEPDARLILPGSR